MNMDFSLNLKERGKSNEKCNDEKKWIVAIYWDLEYAYIEELENADEYITQEEIKEIKAIVIREELSEYF